MLKYLEVFDRFNNVESNDFIELCNKDYNMNNFKNNEIIVWESNDEDSTYTFNEIIDGTLVSNKILKSVHFGIVYKDIFLIDLSYTDEGHNYIRIRKISDLNFKNSTCYKLTII